MIFAATESQKHLAGIYIIKNSINAKVYVGSAVNLKSRYRGHLHQLKKGTHHSKSLQNFVGKYGLDVLRFEVLTTCLKESLLQREQQFIDAFKAADRSFGFNHCLIAGSRLGVKETKEQNENRIGRKQKPETKAKISAAKKGVAKILTAEGRKSFGLKMKGREFSQEHKAKIKASKTGSLNAIAILNNNQVLDIRALFHTKNYKLIAEIYDISPENVRNIVKGLTWGHLPLQDYSARAKRIH